MLSRSEGLDVDGDPDYGYDYVYADGPHVGATQDVDGDEDTDVWYTYTYDEADRLVRMVGDERNNGSLDYTLDRTYTDPVLYVGSTVTDEDADGTADHWDEFAYDALDPLVSYMEDEGADEFVDYIGTVSYDPVTGLVAVQDEETFTPPPDDDWRDWIHDEFTYDSQGRLIGQLTEGEYIDDDYDFDRDARQSWVFGGTCP